MYALACSWTRWYLVFDSNLDCFFTPKVHLVFTVRGLRGGRMLSPQPQKGGMGHLFLAGLWGARGGGRSMQSGSDLWTASDFLSGQSFSWDCRKLGYFRQLACA